LVEINPFLFQSSISLERFTKNDESFSDGMTDNKRGFHEV